MMQSALRQIQPLVGWLIRWWQRLTEPHPAITGLEEQRQAQLLASLVVVLAPVGFITALIPSLIYPPIDLLHATTFLIAVPILLLSFPVYLLSRTPRYRLGAALIIAGISIGVYISVPITRVLDESPLHYFIMAIVLAYVFFSVRFTACLIALFAAAFLILPALVPSITVGDLLIGPVRFVWLFSALLLLVASYLQRIGFDRRAALAESERRYRTVSELMSDFTYSLVITPEGNVYPEWIAGDFVGISGGYQVDEVTQENWLRIVHPDDVAAVLEDAYGIMAGKSVTHEIRFIAKTGGVRWIQYHARPVWEAGSVTRIYGAAKNVTDRKQSEVAERDQRSLAEALRDTAAILNSSLEPERVLDQILLNVARVVPHDAGSIMMVEDGVCRVVRHQDFTQHGAEDDIYDLRLNPLETPTLRRMFETRSPLLIPNVRAFDGWVDVEVHRWIHAFVGTPICIADEVVGFLTLDSRHEGGFTAEHAARLQVFANQASIAIRNARLYESLANEAAELEQRVVRRTVELDRQRRQLQAILDAMGDGMFYTEADCILYTNPVLSQITGYKSEEMIGQSPAVLNIPSAGGSTWANMIAALHQDRVQRSETRLLRKDGKLLDTALTVSLVSEPGEQPVRAVTVVRDISQEKALQAQKRQFIAIASHELRTPITNITTRLYLVRHQPERSDEHLQVIENVVRRMNELTEDLLDLARFESQRVDLKRARVVFQDIIHHTLAMQQAEWQTKNIHLTVDLPSTPVTLMADARRLAQAITNLVSNAFNYTPEGGYVTVTLDTSPDQSWAIISVADSGVGIPPEYLDHVFEPFFRVAEETQVKGTGLGLSITREIVRLHGGEIVVESEPEQGSRFSVRLPLS